MTKSWASSWPPSLKQPEALGILVYVANGLSLSSLGPLDQHRGSLVTSAEALHAVWQEREIGLD